MGWGRGGAGNIEQQQQIGEANKRSSVDLEAQRPTAEASSTVSLSEQAVADSRSTAGQQYAYSGRGGAGNWYSPRELQTKGTFTSAGSPTERSPSSPTSPKSPMSPRLECSTESGLRGRGGAGNFVGVTEEHEPKAKAQEEREIELQDMIRNDVESALQRPDKAYMRNPVTRE